MSEDQVEDLARLEAEGSALLATARAAAQAPAEPGVDASRTVTVALDDQGQVLAVRVAGAWREQVGGDGLPSAVIEAVRDAAAKRFVAWGEAYSEDAAPVVPVLDQDDFQRRLHEVATGPMSASDREAALQGLLELAQAVERGIDEVSARLRQTLDAPYVGNSPDHHVRVTVTGSGEPTAVHFERQWLHSAHEINIGRQTTAAFRDAYGKVASQGVSRLIAESPLGEVQRLGQDPAALAHRLRLTS